MKKNIFLLIISSLTYYKIYSQVSIYTGLNSSNIKNGTVTEISSKKNQGINAGIQINSPIFLNNYSVFSRLGYTQAGSKYEFNDGFYSYNSTLTLDYLNFALLGKYSIKGTDFFSLFAGPQIGYLLKGKSKNTSSYLGETNIVDEDLKEFLKKYDLSMLFGAEIALPINYPIYLSVNYQLGLSNINDDGNNSMKNNITSFIIRYQFN